MQHEVTEQTPLYPSGTYGPRGDHCPKPQVTELTLIPNEVTELTPIQTEVRELTPMRIKVRDMTPLYAGDTHGPEATTGVESLLGYPINGPITYEPKTLPLAHKSNQSLLLDTDYSKTHHIKPMYFTHVYPIVDNLYIEHTTRLFFERFSLDLLTLGLKILILLALPIRFYVFFSQDNVVL